jgi:hypothetical protein
LAPDFPVLVAAGAVTAFAGLAGRGVGRFAAGFVRGGTDADSSFAAALSPLKNLASSKTAAAPMMTPPIPSTMFFLMP